VRYLRRGEAADQPLVCGVRTGWGTARGRLDLTESVASGLEAPLRTNLHAQAGRRLMARTIAVRPMPVEADLPAAQVVATDTSLTSKAAYIATVPVDAPRIAPAVLPQPVRRLELEPPAIPARFDVGELAVPLDEPPRYASRNWRAEAWEREREREQRATERRPPALVRRGS
jgi:hypothetical protein